jgi:RNA polymerase sigma-70 factor (ECF subfamily)
MGADSGEHGTPGQANTASPATPPAPLGRTMLEGVRRREPEALAALFDRYFDDIFNLAYRLTGQKTVAEDVAQDVFLLVHRAAHQLDPTRDPGPWLMTITCNTCKQHWRSQKRRGGRQVQSLDSDPVLVEQVPSQNADPESEAIRTDRERTIMQAVMKLPEPLRIVVALHDFQQLSHEEVAAVIGARPAAVRKRYSRALALLRRHLQGGLE